ncbi:hypothetical protein Acor_47720 [Acrocarpospora corrugata]|uniref:Uncharacterized protein n=1 Tax=Acrocarpospora corrugata TaxID=35763 RepID=A0A5M3W1W4_9ACTN|nr:hypothetical protein [Acrocarpospora corrugata]GES02706.1 hypothetical protein Acor_47720 [Acrocarpospora corrugata]
MATKLIYGTDRKYADMNSLSASALVPLLVLSLLVAVDAWVYADAKGRMKRGYPVVFAVGNFRAGTPEAWMMSCLVAGVAFIPLYLTMTGRNPFK